MSFNFARRALASPKTFYIIVGLLVLQAAWIALTARYPQAFDENYHLGLIQLHSQQWLPFFTSQPPGDALYGALARDPSYLYHYVFALPYIVVRHFTESQTILVIVLRFINIALFAWGLFVYRTLLDELGVTKVLRNIVLLFFVLTPVVPLLAAQINYDNLMFLLTGALFVRTVRYYKALQPAKKPAKTVQFPHVIALQIIAIGAFGSLVKFPFAPIFAATIVALVFVTWRAQRGAGTKLALPSIAALPGTAAKLKLGALGLLALLSLVLCFERYGINLIQYQAPVPKCHKVLSEEACLAYSPWARDYAYAATYPRPTLQGIAVYPGVWVHRTVYETMFTVTSTYWEEQSDNRTIVYYYAYNPLPVANFVAWAVLLVGGLSAAWHWRRIWHNRSLALLLAIILFYVGVLFVQNFAMYLHTGEAVAIHGRYLVPVFPVLYLVLALGVSWLLSRLRLQKIRNLLFVAIFVLFLQGAGVITWIVRAEPWWYWPQSSVAARANWLAKNVLYKIIIH